MSKYSEQLKSQRWQETRGRINGYAKGRCEYCNSKTDNPEVHHEQYNGDHPSDTGDDFLKSLCPECHFELHWIKRLRLYSAEKRRLYKAKVWIDDEMHQRLIAKYRV